MAQTMSLLLILLSLSLAASNGAYNVIDFGAKPDGVSDNKKAFLDAWAKVCSSTQSASIYVPPGKFLVSEAHFMGPCKQNSVEIYIDGTIVAPSGYTSAPKWILFQYIEGFSIFGGTLDGQGQSMWNCRTSGSNCSEASTSFTIAQSKDVKIQGLTSVNSEGFHMLIFQSSGVTMQNIQISAPSNSPNTDGIHLQLSDHVIIQGSNIKTGDDCISMGAGTRNVLIKDTYCGPGHGISIGSLGSIAHEQGVQNVTVSSVVFRDTTNGVRIKTWEKHYQGYVQFIMFQNIVMYNVSNPIIIDQRYCPHNKNCPNQTSGVKISNVIYSNIRGYSDTEVAMKFDCSPSNPCQGISLQDIRLTYQNQQAKSFCDNASGFNSGTITPPSCL
ncbi:Pectin lyase-like superfamily protein [Rhynchospora pubera]|uniref:Exopolygalacturonase n=1 Tax=Rhynchospora pubera TaxID=906938 RepID=A0AAV8C8T2_9POAL|nr:Pectin lyase-like superfamily protein [Rhynchospora pubera]